MDAWNDELRSIRERRGMSRDELAERCGLSAHSLRSYELGRRRPTRDHLLDLLRCLTADERSRSIILAGAGLAPEAPVDRFREPNVPPREAARLIRHRPLPAVLLNDRTEVLAVSGAAWRLFGMPEYEANPPKHRSALTEITFRAIAARVQNWDEVIGQILQFLKAGLPADHSIESAGTPITTIVRKLAAADPSMWERFVRVWRASPPFRGRMTGHTYPGVWSVPGGTIRFNVFVGCLNTEVGLYAHTMVPADAQSHLLLDELLAGRPSRRRARRR
ncbi:MAG: XRE family transcriptional regulator [Dehalococcoidia bacterium]|nr:MAG: XRE family transcriptional regulator [Dehalococcoidia bacterium]